MCKYCNEDENANLLESDIEMLDDIFLCFAEDSLMIKAGDIRKHYETEQLRVFYDRGNLRLTKGDDICCLDHSEDRIEISFCPMCGRKIN